MHKYLATLLILMTHLAYSYCQLNIRGDNICLNEKALEIIENKDDNSRTHNIVTIKEINYPEIKVRVNGEREDRMIHIDSLSGNLTCEEMPVVCKGEKVVLYKDCTGDKKDKEFTVENIYSEDIIEIKRGMMFFEKSSLIPVACIKSLNLEDPTILATEN